MGTERLSLPLARLRSLLASLRVLGTTSGKNGLPAGRPPLQSGRRSAWVAASRERACNKMIVPAHYPSSRRRESCHARFNPSCPVLRARSMRHPDDGR
jgi:hypothetical protein